MLYNTEKTQQLRWYKLNKGNPEQVELKFLKVSIVSTDFMFSGSEFQDLGSHPQKHIVILPLTRIFKHQSADLKHPDVTCDFSSSSLI